MLDKNNQTILQQPIIYIYKPAEMSASSYRKLHNYQEVFHTNMVAIPFFLSQVPTNTIAMRGVPQNLLAEIQSHLMQKLYYKNNKPIITNIASFQSVAKAEQFRSRIGQHMKSSKKRNFCQFCKDISQFEGILFQAGKIYVSPPQTKQMKQIIETISQSVLMSGADIEEKLRMSEQPLLSFLNERILSLEHTYYRWRVYSYLQGDGDKKHRLQEYQMVRNGPLWYPPQNPNPNAYPLVLNFEQTKYFTDCLLNMQRRKYAIQQLMVFAIQNINYAVHIASMVVINLYENLKADFIGTFYLISDILYNSPTNVYRNLFQALLPMLIYRYVLLRQNDQLNAISQKHLTQLKKILAIWEKKFVFDQSSMKGTLFLLQLCNIQKVYELKSYPEHQKVREIFGGESYLIQLEKACIQNGIPFFQNKEEQAKLFLNALFWSNQQVLDVQPGLGKYDGQPLNDKQILKVHAKGIKVLSCGGLPTSMLFQKNYKNQRNSQTSLSQDGN